MTTPTARAGHETPDPARLVAAHRHARAFYRDQLHHAAGPRRYLTHRGFGQLLQSDVDTPWLLGYAPPGPANLVDHLTTAGFTPTELIDAGLATRSRTGRRIDRFRDRIMFPIHTATGDPVGFLGRAAPGAGPQTPKYLNSPDTAIYHKGQILYGAGEQAHVITAGAAPTLVEGPLDVLAVALAFPDRTRIALAVCGTALTAHHVAALATMPGTARHGITIALDADDAGRNATDRAWQLLAAHPGIDLHAATLPDQTDPGGLITSHTGATVLGRALTEHARQLAQAVIDNRLDQLTAHHPDLLRWIDGRVQAARALTTLIIDLPADQVVALTGHIAKRTGVGYDTVAAAVIGHLERPPATHTTRTPSQANPPDPRPLPFTRPGTPVGPTTPTNGMALQRRAPSRAR